MKISRETFLIESLRHCGLPYIWGGESPTEGADCSGYVEIVLKQFGLDPDGRQTAQAYYNHFSKPQNGKVVKRDEVKLGTLIFFGKSTKQITHIAIGLTSQRMVESAGGGSSTTNKKIAATQNAKVRVSAIDRRSDRVAYVDINGLELV